MTFASGITSTGYIATGLTPGVTYSFKVAAKNGYGVGDYSEPVAVLAAQRPDTPVAPTTTIYGNYDVKISWPEPFTGGSPITGYTILIRMYDEISFAEDPVNCDGTDPVIIAQQFCLVPISALKSLPYELEWDTGVYANVQAYNSYGYSGISPTGNGAIITTVPDAPINLQNVPSLTTATQIGFVWEDGAFDGGKQVLDYRIWYDQGEGLDYPTYYVL